jgi:mannose-6-phosphate isomerase
MTRSDGTTDPTGLPSGAALPSGAVLPLENPIRPYAWGSVDFIPRLLGNEPTDEPAAELWMGAHPGSPSQLADAGASLLELIESDPEAVLGSASVRAFGPRLPFLLKVLAAAGPLSIQAHPTVEQARAGFAAENARGLAPDDPERNYVDANHKPELICALTDFEALVGFRALASTVELLRALIAEGATELEGYPERLAADGGLREVVTALVTLPAARTSVLIDSAMTACARLAAADGPWVVEAQTSVELAEQYPGDVGAVLALLMNRVRLSPGQAMFLSAGRIHAYLRGAGVEVMASSDNVLRSGLTAKRVDVAELLRVLYFEPDAAEPVAGSPDGAVLHFPVPVPDFRLSRVQLAGELELDGAGPRILLCTAGSVRIEPADGHGDPVELGPGRAAFAVAERAIRLAGAGDVFVATTNLPETPL